MHMNVLQLKSDKGRLYLIPGIARTELDDVIELIRTKCDLVHHGDEKTEIMTTGAGCNLFKTKLEEGLNVRYCEQLAVLNEVIPWLIRSIPFNFYSKCSCGNVVNHKMSARGVMRRWLVQSINLCIVKNKCMMITNNSLWTGELHVYIYIYIHIQL